MLPQFTYTGLITGLKEENITLNRKVLSELAMNEPYSFKALVDQVRFMRGPQAAAVTVQGTAAAAALDK